MVSSGLLISLAAPGSPVLWGPPWLLLPSVLPWGSSVSSYPLWWSSAPPWKSSAPLLSCTLVWTFFVYGARICHVLPLFLFHFHIGHLVCFSLFICSRSSLVTLVFDYFSHLFDIEFVIFCLYALFQFLIVCYCLCFKYILWNCLLCCLIKMTLLFERIPFSLSSFVDQVVTDTHSNQQPNKQTRDLSGLN